MKQFVKHNLFLFGANGISKTLAAATFVVLARYLGPDDLGKYIFAITLVAYFGTLTDLSLNTLVIRAVAQNRADGPRYYTNMVALRLGIAAPILGTLLLLTILLDKPGDAKAVILIGALGLLVAAIANSNTALFSAFERFEYVALLMVASSTLTTFAIVGLLAQGYKIVPLALAQAIAQLIVCLISCWLLLRHVVRPSNFQSPIASLDFGFCRILLRRTFPFALAAVLSILYNRLDVAILSFAAGDRAVGWYSSVYLIVNTLLVLLPGTFATVLYPNLSRVYQTTPARIAYLLPLAQKTMLVTGLPIALTGALMAEPIVGVLYSTAFAEAAPLLQILIWILPLGALCTVSMFAAYSMNRERAVLRIMAILLAVNVIGNLLVVPHYGARGAAMVAVGCQILNLGLYYRLGRGGVTPPLHWRRLALALAGLAITLVLVREQFLPLALILAAIVYAALLLLLRVITPTEWQLLKDNIAPPQAQKA